MSEPQHNYVPKLIEAATRERLPAGLHHIAVLHDGWCNLINHRGPCNCNPEIGPPVSHSVFMAGAEPTVQRDSVVT